MRDEDVAKHGSGRCAPAVCDVCRSNASPRLSGPLAITLAAAAALAAIGVLVMVDRLARNATRNVAAALDRDTR